MQGAGCREQGGHHRAITRSSYRCGSGSCSTVMSYNTGRVTLSVFGEGVSGVCMTSVIDDNSNITLLLHALCPTQLKQHTVPQALSGE